MPRSQLLRRSTALHTLVEGGYILAVRDLPKPAVGTAARVHALSRKGRGVLVALGECVPEYYRPSETTGQVSNPLFTPHTLAVIDVLIAAERLTHDTADIRLLQLVLERELRQLAYKVTVPAGEYLTPQHVVTVIPDAAHKVLVLQGLPLGELRDRSKHPHPKVKQHIVAPRPECLWRDVVPSFPSIPDHLPHT
jgi:hypothetical protein